MMPERILELLRAGDMIVVPADSSGPVRLSAPAVPAVRHDASDYSRTVLRELIALHRRAKRK